MAQDDSADHDEGKPAETVDESALVSDDSDSDSDDSDSDDGAAAAAAATAAPGLSEYEQLRQRNILRNNAKMESLGLTENTLMKKEKKPRSPRKPKSKVPS